MEHRRPPPEIAVLNAVAEAHRLFSDLAVRLRERRDVREVVRTLHVAPGPSIDLYTDAELDNGEAVSWGVEAVLSDGEWIIASSLRRNHAHGQDEVRVYYRRGTRRRPTSSRSN
jgi:hypothetical protein